MEHGLSSFVNFSYYPVNHVDGATGAFVCQSVDNGTVTDLDCEGTRYDSCLVDVYGGGGVAKQRGIARFLRCYEGPYANEEALANASRREPCFRAAGLAFAPVRACYANRARVSQLAQRFNRSKALMMASLGAAHAPWDPGYFPHIFVDGKHQWNMTWTSLTRTLCAAIADSDGVVQGPPACAPVRLRLRFTVSGSDAVSGLGSGSSSGAPDRDWRGAVVQAVNGAASEDAFPRHFETDDDGSGYPGHAYGGHSYVNARAVDADSSTCGTSTRGSSTAAVAVDCVVVVLRAFSANALSGVQSRSAGVFQSTLATALHVPADAIGDVLIQEL